MQRAGRLAQLGLLLLELIQARAQQDAGWQSGTVGLLGFGSTYAAAQGACGYGEQPEAQWPYGFYAAIDPATSPLAAGTAQQGCGICLEVECTDVAACGSQGSLVVLVTDHCTGCGAGAVYLAPAAYSQVAGATSLGQVGGRSRRVNCDPPGDMSVRVDQYQTSQGSWVRLALTQVAGSGDITGVALAPSDSPDSWLPMQRTFGASWELSNLPAPPLDLRATDATGQQVVARRALQQAQAGSYPTSAQFQATSALATALGAGPRFRPVQRSPPPPPAPLSSPAVPPPTPLPAPAPPLQPAAAPAPAPEAEPTPSVQLQPVNATVPPLSALFPVPESSAVQPTGGAGSATSQGFALPQPTAGAPIVNDTRPPRPPGVGPSVTPAPVSFSPAAGLPTLPPQPPAAGPIPRDQVATAGSVDPSTCLTLGDILGRIPEASNWTQLLGRVGLDVLLRDKNARVTLLVPINSALNAGIDARPFRNESTLAELILNAPEIENPLAGYHVLPGLWPTNALQPGAQMNTSDTIDKVNFLKITAQGPSSLQGIGTSANILQADIVACGPSVVHIVDQVLLPFRFDQAAIDAITGTQVPLSPVPAGR